MKLLILFGAIIALAWAEIDYDAEEKKYNIDKATNFKNHLIPFNTRLALEANYFTKGHFIISGHSVWYKLASFSEDLAHKELFALCNLPDDSSARQKFYSIALSLEGFGEDVNFGRSNYIAIDDTVDLGAVKALEIPFGMPDYLPSIKFEKPFGHVQKYVPSYEQNIPYSSHTVLLDHLMFDSFWNKGFSAKPIQRGPFYNNQGESIATLEYLRMKGKVRTAHYPTGNVKVIEIPIGVEGTRYMILAVGDTAEAMIDAVCKEDIFSKLTLNENDIEVVIPKLSFSSGLDMASVFKDMKSSKEFSDPSTISKSDEPVTPLGYFQMVTVNITDSVGRQPLGYQDVSNSELDFTTLDKDCFIVNKPFLFSLFVPHYLTDVRIPVFTGMYSYPGEIGQNKHLD